ncbi:MAG TPA: amidohydrolase [Bryobacteraceae bacterium]|nr:amidohydrolase [Bryobacteraceae bacterium]
MPTILARFSQSGRWVITAIFLSAWSLQAQPADLIVDNVRVHTGNPKQPRATAIAVRGTRFLYVGDDPSRHVGSSTRRINANNGVLIAGFIDSHGHMAGLGDLLESLNFRGVKSTAAVAEMVRGAAQTRPKGEWIKGRAWDQTEWGGAFPTAEILDKAAPDHPIYLSRVDGHAAWVNTRALERADIQRQTPDPAGGKIYRDGSGKATGILIDRAQGLVASKIRARTPEQIERAISLAAQECVRFGITSVHDAGIGSGELAAYRSLILKGKLPVRVYAMIGGAGNLWNEYLKKGPELSEKLTVRSVKLVSDGAMGSRGAAFLQPYADDAKNSGLLILSGAEIEKIARQAIERGFQVNTHAIGDRANRTVLEAYKAVLGGKNDRRFRIEHAQVVDPSDIKLFAENSIIASIQSTHATSDMRWAESRLGKARLAGAWLAQTFLAAGVPIANGSDFPVEETNPLLGFYAAVTRQDASGNPPGGFLPKEKLTRDQALRSWTLGGAYAAFEEAEKGSIEVGKLADFVILSEDLTRTAEVRLTVVGGEIVYQAR